MDPGLPATIERVTFHLTVPAESHPSLAVLNWEFVDEVLVRLRSLRAVVVEFSAGSVAPTEKLSKRLARVAGRGMLEFRIGEVSIPCLHVEVPADFWVVTCIQTGVPWWEVPV